MAAAKQTLPWQWPRHAAENGFVVKNARLGAPKCNAGPHAHTARAETKARKGHAAGRNRPYCAAKRQHTCNLTFLCIMEREVEELEGVRRSYKELEDNSIGYLFL